MGVLQINEQNRKHVLYQFIYDRFKYYKAIPKMDQLQYAWTDNTVNNHDNTEWWAEMKELCKKFIF